MDKLVKIEIENENEITFQFGKNGKGLTTELITIGEKINELSKNSNIYLRKVFVDELDDVYSIKIVIKNELNEIKKLGKLY